MLKGSRLFEGKDMTEMEIKFKKRQKELETLFTTTGKIKNYIKTNKQVLLRDKREDEFKINEIRKSHHPESGASTRSYSFASSEVDD